MADRTTETTVTFAHPFRPSAGEGLLSAGTYRVVTDEEEILGVSFLAFRRAATWLHVPALTAPPASHQVVPIDPDELAALLEVDQRPASGEGRSSS